MFIKTSTVDNINTSCIQKLTIKKLLTFCANKNFKKINYQHHVFMKTSIVDIINFLFLSKLIF